MTCGFKSHLPHQKRTPPWGVLFWCGGERIPFCRFKSICPDGTRKTTLTVFFHTIFPSGGFVRHAPAGSCPGWGKSPAGGRMGKPPRSCDFGGFLHDAAGSSGTLRQGRHARMGKPPAGGRMGKPPRSSDFGGFFCVMRFGVRHAPAGSCPFDRAGSRPR